jgi:hypothetical protein
MTTINIMEHQEFQELMPQLILEVVCQTGYFFWPVRKECERHRIASNSLSMACDNTTFAFLSSSLT